MGGLRPPRVLEHPHKTKPVFATIYQATLRARKFKNDRIQGLKLKCMTRRATSPTIPVFPTRLGTVSQNTTGLCEHTTDKAITKRGGNLSNEKLNLNLDKRKLRPPHRLPLSSWNILTKQNWTSIIPTMQKSTRAIPNEVKN